MRRFVGLVVLLVLAVLHAPSQAQALLFFDLFPSELISTNEPVILLLTGVALITLARVGVQRRGATESMAGTILTDQPAAPAPGRASAPNERAA
jgi:hypothetical protein